MLTPTAQGAILIYEDDAICAHAFASVLRHAGHTAQIVTHFQPALGALGTDLHIDVLLADILFPAGAVNGLALSRMALIKRPTLKVIYATGYDLDGAVARMAIGPVLRKPVSDETLLSWVERALKGGEFWWL